jgi:UDP-N-acetylglucosamine--N-acetylmuramyl-(pentapeptide) pyrophosphoryl-undecaprenol N-acetylglucosamine transferase
MKVSRGDQIHNARYFEKQGISAVLDDEQLTVKSLMKALDNVCQNKSNIIASIQALGIVSATDQIIGLLEAH